MSDSMLVITPVLVLVATGVLVMAADAFASRGVAVALGVLGLLVACMSSGWVSVAVQGGLPAYGVMHGGGGMSASVCALLALATLALLGGSQALASESGGGTATALIAFASAGSVALAQSTDILMSVIALETIAVCAYGLVAGSPGPRSAEAGMKYAIQGAVASGLIVLGTAILLGLYGGESSFEAIIVGMAGKPLLPAATAASLVIGGFAFKLGAVPFHSWAPDAFETTRPGAAAFLAASPKIGAILGLVILVAYLFAGVVENLTWQFAVIAVLSILVGNLGGLRQASYGRLLGYSGIAQIGYALVGITVGLAVGEGGLGMMLPPTLVLIVAYGIGATGAFVAAQAVRDERPEWDGSVAGMGGLFKDRPILAFAIAACMLSMTGIPLTAGFWGKLLVFGTAASEGLLWLAAIGVIGSVVSFGYYGSVLRSVFFDEVHAAEDADALPVDADLTDLVQKNRVAEFVAFTMGVTLIAVGIVPMFTGIASLLALFAN